MAKVSSKMKRKTSISLNNGRDNIPTPLHSEPVALLQLTLICYNFLIRLASDIIHIRLEGYRLHHHAE